MKLIILIIFSVIFLVLLTFSILNFHSVEINLGVVSLSMPLAVILAIELVVGISIGILAAFLQIMRLKSDYSQLNKKFNKQSK